MKTLQVTSSQVKGLRVRCAREPEAEAPSITVHLPDLDAEVRVNAMSPETTEAQIVAFSVLYEEERD